MTLGYQAYDTSKPESYTQQMQVNAANDTGGALLGGVGNWKRWWHDLWPWNYTDINLYSLNPKSVDLLIGLMKTMVRRKMNHGSASGLLTQQTRLSDEIIKSYDLPIVVHIVNGNTPDENSMIEMTFSEMMNILFNDINRFDEIFVNSSVVSMDNLESSEFIDFFGDLKKNIETKDLFINPPDSTSLVRLNLKGVCRKIGTDVDALTVLAPLALFKLKANKLGIGVVHLFIKASNWEECQKLHSRKADAHHFVHLAQMASDAGDIRAIRAMCSPDCKVLKYNTITEPRNEYQAADVECTMTQWLDWARSSNAVNEFYHDDISYETIKTTSHMIRISGEVAFRFMGVWPRNKNILKATEPALLEVEGDGVERMIRYGFEYDIYYDLTGRICRFEIHRDMTTMLDAFKIDSDLVTRTMNEAIVNVTKQNRSDLAEEIYESLDLIMEKEKVGKTISSIKENLINSSTDISRDEVAMILGSYLASSIKK